MILFKRFTYTNKLKEREQPLYHESEELARTAAKGNEKAYSLIASKSEYREYRCDACLDEGKASKAGPHPSGKDLCSDHVKALLQEGK